MREEGEDVKYELVCSKVLIHTLFFSSITGISGTGCTQFTEEARLPVKLLLEC